MFFVLSKTIDFLLMPLTMVCIVLIAAALIKRDPLRKRLQWTGIVMLLFFTNDFISNEFMAAWEIKTIPFADMKQHEVGIVLTGATSYLLPNDRVYFNKGADRVTHTVQLYKLGLIKKILISGGVGLVTKNRAIEPEANQFKKAMMLMGIPEADIIIESATRNTHESAARVKPMLDSLNYSQEQCLLITSAFHMRRSLACYRKVGLEIEPFTTDFYSHPREFTLDVILEPRLDAVVDWHKLFKEWVGLIAYKLAGYA